MEWENETACANCVYFSTKVFFAPHNGVSAPRDEQGKCFVLDDGVQWVRGDHSCEQFELWVDKST